MVETTSNLLPERTSFVGRDDELEQLDRLFDEIHRLVTILGAPGIGKTRLAQQYALKCLQDGEKKSTGVWFCDLTEALSADELVSNVAAALDVPLLEGKTADESLTQLGFALANRGRVLLILDNFEQVIGYADTVIGRWLDMAPEACFLVTSRDRLRLEGEVCLELSPLTQQAAVELFLQRARQRCLSFDWCSSDPSVLNELVTRLDRLPLAIELAAARVTILPPAELLKRLRERFRLLRETRRDISVRQSTLEKAIEWSWNLLTDNERSTLAQLTTFRGGFSLEAAEAVAKTSAQTGALSTIELVESLVDKSLVRSDVSGEATRFGLFESIREYVDSKLTDSGDRPTVERRHADYYLAKGELWSAGLDGIDALSCQQNLWREADNLIKIRSRFAESKPETAVRVALLVETALEDRQSVGVRHNMLVATLKDAGDQIEPELIAQLRLVIGRLRIQLGMQQLAEEDFRVAAGIAKQHSLAALESKTYLAMGQLAEFQGNLKVAVEHLTRTLDIARGVDDKILTATALSELGYAKSLENKQLGSEYLEQALDIAKEIRSPRVLGWSASRLAFIYYFEGRIDEAQKLWEQAERAADQIGDRILQANVRMGEIVIQFDRGQIQIVELLLKEKVSWFRKTGNRRSLGLALSHLGFIQTEFGCLDQGRRSLEESLAILSESDRSQQNLVSGNLGRIAQEKGDFELAWRLLKPALRDCRVNSSLRIQAQLLGYVGILAAEENDLAHARDYLGQSEQLSSQSKEAESEATAQIFGGIVEALEGRPAESRTTLNEARQTLLPLNQVGLLGTVNLAEGLLDIAKAQRSKDPSERERFLEAAEQRLLNGLKPKPPDECLAQRTPAPTELSFSARVVYRLLKAKLSQIDPERFSDLPEQITPTALSETASGRRPTHRLLIHKKGMWFQLAEEEQVDLSRRRSLRMMMLKFADHRQKHPGQGLSTFDLFEAGWPDESIAVEASINRVYVAIRTLRKLGLQDDLVTGESGYFLDPQIALVWS